MLVMRPRSKSLPIEQSPYQAQLRCVQSDDISEVYSIESVPLFEESILIQVIKNSSLIFESIIVIILLLVSTP